MQEMLATRIHCGGFTILYSREAALKVFYPIPTGERKNRIF